MQGLLLLELIIHVLFIPSSILQKVFHIFTHNLLKMFDKRQNKKYKKINACKYDLPLTTGFLFEI